MKKLTKRVKAGRLWFDVPLDTTYIAAVYLSPCIKMAAFNSKSKPEIITGDNYCPAWSGLVTQFICVIDLNGTDWRECCWYVGDQTDGETVERREWMARGVDALGAYFNFSEPTLVQIAAKNFAAKIRAGEVE